MKKSKGSIAMMMRNPNIAALIVVILVSFGIYALFIINKQEFPEFTIRQGVIVGIYPGATSEEIEEQLTKPLEEYLFGYEEINKKRTYSYSRNDMVFIFAELNKNVHEKDPAWSKIKHGLKTFQATLPAGVLGVIVNDDFGNASSILLSMESKDKSYRDMESYMDMLCERLRTLDETGKLNVYGTVNEEINIYIDQEKLASYGIDSKTLMLTLFTQGFTTTAGNIDNGDIISPIHIVSPYTTEESIAEQIIFTDLKGNVLRMKDIADIKREYAKPTSYINNNGVNSLILSIEMRSGKNIVKFGKEVDKVLDDFNNILPDDVTIAKITDMPYVVDKSVTGFLLDLLKSILIVIAIMLLLFPLRSALVAAFSIPLSTAITIGFMYILGIELNTVTLAALIVVLGMIVDNSIVIIDGYLEYLGKGYSRWYSAMQSTKTYAPSLFMATFAISIMFYPFLFTLTGVFEDFVRYFPPTITIALFVSLGLAIYVIPFLEFRYIKTVPNGNNVKGFAKVQNKFFVFLQNSYEKLLALCFRFPILTLCFAFLTISLGVIIFLNLPVQMMPNAERETFAVEIYLPGSASLDKTAIVSDSLQNILLEDDRVVSVTAFVGTSSPRFMLTYAPNIPGPNYAQFIVKTTDNRTCEEVIGDYYSKYIDYFPEAVVRFKQLDYQSVRNPIEIRLYGDDIAEVKRYADTITSYMYSLEGELAWIHSDYDGNIPMAEINIDQTQAIKLGITKTLVNTNLAANLSGLPITSIYEGSYKIPVKLRTVSDNKSILSLNDQMISTAIPGVQVPLRQIADVDVTWKPAQITHRNGIQCLTISADVTYGRSKAESMAKVNKYIKKHIEPNIPESITIEYGGLQEENVDIIPEVLQGIIFAILIMFLFLVFSFRKIAISFLSIAAIVLCLFGSFFGLWITDLDLGFTAILGMVNLVGIIVRNAIIMFQYAESLKDEKHMTPKDAAFEAGKRRMRSIFLTSATTAVGVMPMIISGSTLWMPMGIVIFFGTFLSIGLIVTILPIAYWKIFRTPKTQKI